MLQRANPKHGSKTDAITPPRIDSVSWRCSVLKGIIQTAAFPGQHTSAFLDCPARFSRYLRSGPCRNRDGNFSNVQQRAGKLGGHSSQSRGQESPRFTGSNAAFQSAGTGNAARKRKTQAMGCSSLWPDATRQDKAWGVGGMFSKIK